MSNTGPIPQFQSTYLYKVRQMPSGFMIFTSRFNPRTYIRYDRQQLKRWYRNISFNPRTYIRYDFFIDIDQRIKLRFNPRTYIRYDQLTVGEFIDLQFQSTYLYKVRLFAPT